MWLIGAYTYVYNTVKTHAWDANQLGNIIILVHTYVDMNNDLGNTCLSIVHPSLHLRPLLFVDKSYKT